MKILKFFTTFLALASTVAVTYFVLDRYILNVDEMLFVEETKMGDFKEVQEISNIEHFKNNVKINKEKPFPVLLLGVDSDDFKGTRSDTIILAIVDPAAEKISLLSIYRDLLVNIPEKEGFDKLNAAYAYGGVDLTAMTIEQLFGVPIEHYAVINFKGFEELIDAIDGVVVDVEKNMNTKGRSTNPPYDLFAGEQKLTGKQALEYVRFRGDAEGDFGRTRRQKQTITAIIDQTMELRNIKNIFGIYNAIKNNLDTNISKMDIASLAIKLRNVSGDDVETIEMQGYPTNRNGVSYVEVNDQEIERVKSELNERLNGMDLEE